MVVYFVIMCELESTFFDFKNCGFLTDFTIKSSDNLNFQVHRLVLCAKTEYFKTLFSNQRFVENIDQRVCLPYHSNLIRLCIEDLYGKDVKNQLTDDNTAHYLDFATSMQAPKLFETVIRHMRKTCVDSNCVTYLELCNLFQLTEQPCLSFSNRLYANELMSTLRMMLCANIHKYFHSEGGNDIDNLVGTSLDYRFLSPAIMKIFLESGPDYKIRLKNYRRPFAYSLFVPLSDVLTILSRWVDFDFDRISSLDSIFKDVDFLIDIHEIRSLCVKNLILHQSMKNKLSNMIQEHKECCKIDDLLDILEQTKCLYKDPREFCISQ